MLRHVTGRIWAEWRRGCVTAAAWCFAYVYLRFTGDVNLWYSPEQRSVIKARISEATPRLYQIAERTCRRLVPGDEQPIEATS